MEMMTAVDAKRGKESRIVMCVRDTGEKTLARPFQMGISAAGGLETDGSSGWEEEKERDLGRRKVWVSVGANGAFIGTVWVRVCVERERNAEGDVCSSDHGSKSTRLRSAYEDGIEHGMERPRPVDRRGCFRQWRRSGRRSLYRPAFEFVVWIGRVPLFITGKI